jgi:hypothetical protein
MTELAEHFQIDFNAAAPKKAVVLSDKLRITILTAGLLRLEFDPQKEFDDRPTQLVWKRELKVPDFSYKKDEQQLTIETEKLKLKYLRDGKDLTADNLKITVKANKEKWFYGEEDDQNLKGTFRTLDEADGAVLLDKGLLSKSGWTLIDDTESLTFNETGWLEARKKAEEYQDLYFLAYGDDYQRALKDFSKISGEIPLLPRWSLGNWWSRYWEYSDQELKELMLEFEEKEIPLSVCIVDMDWHQVENKYTSGWTGYSWNDDFFPEPAEFTDWLHQKGLKTALNLHPAEGVHPHEDNYQQFAEFKGLNPDSEKGIEFDLSDHDFINGYFKFLHNPLEDKEGIDFWWLDWQQGTDSGLKGVDPLWGLNHLHYYDLARNQNKRNFIFSRWGGMGSHRYPIGFSGDTVVSWDSLKFQPYFTSTASNVLYGWWSHDIGGHCMGTEDRELYTRWMQFGVFSPIMRLHSTKDPYLDRRPWGHGAEVFEIAKEYMQLRHQLIPYLYTQSFQAQETALSLIRPMYYQEKSEPAYSLPDQYYFGSELLVAPFLEPTDQMTNLSQKTLWMPEGQWFDYFSGEYYQGERWLNKYGDLSEIPLFAKAGAIIPLAGEVEFGNTANPEKLEVQIFPGADNSFELYEDNGAAVRSELKTAKTIFKNSWQQKQLKFEILPLAGSKGVIPQNRSLELIFKAVNKPEVEILVDAKEKEADIKYDEQHKMLKVKLDYQPQSKYQINLKSEAGLLNQENNKVDKIKKLLKNFKLETAVKTELAKSIEKAAAENEGVEFLERFNSVLSQTQQETLIDLIYDCGSAHLKNGGTDQIVLFKGSLEELSYNFSKAVLTTGHHRSSLENDKGKVENYKLIDLKELEVDKWELTINYSDFIKKNYSSEL